MNYRELGRTGWKVSEVGFGAWAIGGSWGEVPTDQARDALHAALDEGVNFIDTADVYGDGRSEKIIAKTLRERKDSAPIYIATKAGRRLDPHEAGGYNRENLRRFVERSLKNLQVESLDLLQLHCPPSEVFYQPETFAALDEMADEGKIKSYGVSVEKVEEAIKATEYSRVQSVQIIYNIFRQRPADLFFKLAKERGVGVIARVPLSSGMLTGKMRPDSEFAEEDHRNFNRHGEQFDVGETFSGLDFERGLKAVEKLRPLVPENATMAQMALRWILMSDAVTTTIPGAKNPEQAQQNASASALPPLVEDAMKTIRAIYDEGVKEQVHQRW